jgi:hypothetical protein
MSFEPTLDRQLAEALGDFSPLIAELRATFLASATGHVAALSLATDIETWRSEAARLQGLAASFGMIDLMQKAGDALRSGPDAALLDRIATALGACRSA